ncbi:MAG: hypothetical protein JSS60_07790 [Verrucomicrobia bacterium]|nr:hypothetical protein [Verrucomicrobiota bacterium]
MSTRLDFTLTVPNHLALRREINLQSNSSTSSSDTNNYLPPVGEIYTGTKDQPDVASVFYKPNANEIYISDEQLVNDLGHSPIEFMSALRRINNAVKMLFQELKQGMLFKENSESWNALKNLSRGIIQLVPFLGNAVLYIHDLARTHFSIHPKIKSALSNQEGPVVGMAFEGKPIFTVPASLLYPNATMTPAETKALLKVIWLGSIKRTIENNHNYTRSELAENMHQMLLNRQFVGPTTTSSIN